MSLENFRLNRRKFIEIVTTAASSTVLGLPPSTPQETQETDPYGFWSWASCDTSHLPEETTRRSQFNPGHFLGEFALFHTQPISPDTDLHRNLPEIAILVPRNDQDQPLYQPSLEEITAISEAARQTAIQFLSAGIDNPTPIEITNRQAETKQIIPVLFTPFPDLNAYLAESEWDPSGYFASKSCQIGDGSYAGYTVHPDDNQVLPRSTKIISVSPLPESPTLPLEAVHNFLSIMAAHESAHFWQSRFPIMARDSHRAHLPIDFEALATWLGLFTQWSANQPPLPDQYQQFITDVAHNQLADIHPYNRHREPGLPEITHQRDYGAFIFWQGLYSLIEKSHTSLKLPTDPDTITNKILTVHILSNQLMVDYIASLDQGIPDPSESVRFVGREIYQQALEQTLDYLNLGSGQNIYQTAQAESLTQALNPNSWIYPFTNGFFDQNNFIIIPSQTTTTLGFQDFNRRNSTFLEITNATEIHLTASKALDQDTPPSVFYTVIILDDTSPAAIHLSPDFRPDPSNPDQAISQLSLDLIDSPVIVIAKVSGQVRPSQRDNYPNLLTITPR